MAALLLAWAFANAADALQSGMRMAQALDATPADVCREEALPPSFAEEVFLPETLGLERILLEEPARGTAGSQLFGTLLGDAGLDGQGGKGDSEGGLETAEEKSAADKEHALDGAGVIGFASFSDAPSCMEALQAALAEKGWLETQSGLDGFATFIKESGTLRWLSVQCVDLTDGTTVLLQYLGASER